MLRFSRVFRDMAPELKLMQLPVIFVKTTLGPEGGFAGEERLIARETAEKFLEDGTCVAPTPENRAGVWAFNAETNQHDRFIERDSNFLALQARKRQWLDMYWRVNTGYLMVGRMSWGQGWLLNCPLRKRDVSQKLWEQLQVRADWRLIEFREQDRRTGMENLGHNWCWLYMPGAEELGIDREVYDNKRVKVRLHVRKMSQYYAMY
jgi:hypothetical protein